LNVTAAENRINPNMTGSISPNTNILGVDFTDTPYRLSHLACWHAGSDEQAGRGGRGGKCRRCSVSGQFAAS
jgi:hypothetical protein